jgi:ribosomal protein S18 acetylase RimI-like enzyme
LLLNHLFVVFRERGIDVVTLSVPADESGAKEFYDKLGFETRGYFLKKKLQPNSRSDNYLTLVTTRFFLASS